MSECDNKSVGVIITNSEDEILLIQRARFPFGLAPPAGHVDDHGSLKKAAVEEVSEETGLVISESKLVTKIADRMVQNRCRRTGGSHHVWNVYSTDQYTGELSAKLDEAKTARWYSPAAIQEIADYTQSHAAEKARESSQVIEQVWLDFFIELGIVQKLLQ